MQDGEQHGRCCQYLHTGNSQYYQYERKGRKIVLKCSLSSNKFDQIFSTFSSQTPKPVIYSPSSSQHSHWTNGSDSYEQHYDTQIVHQYLEIYMDLKLVCTFPFPHNLYKFSEMVSSGRKYYFYYNVHLSTLFILDQFMAQRNEIQ